MPLALAASPRNRLPPPITTAVCTPISWISPTSLAICVVTAGSIPNACSPIKASPESLRSTRRYIGADISGRLYLPAPCASSAHPRKGAARRRRTGKEVPRASAQGTSVSSSRWGSGGLPSLAHLEAHEPRNRDVLSQLGDRRLDLLADRDLGVTDRRLIHQANLLVETPQLAL